MTRLVPTALCLLAFAATSFADDAPTPAPLPPPPPAPAPLAGEAAPAPGATAAPAGTTSPTPSPATPPAASLPAPTHLPAGAALPATLAPAGTSSGTATPTVNASQSPVRYAAPGAPRASVPVVSSSASSLGEIAKQHNLDMGGGTPAVRLVVPVEAVGLRSETLAVVIRFYDAAGRPIASVFPTWGDATGQLRVVSGEYVPAAARDRASFAFEVPYGAFPRDPAGLHVVEARATLVQRTPTGRRVLAVRSTRFYVE